MGKTKGVFIRGYDAGYAAGRRDAMLSVVDRIRAGEPHPVLKECEEYLLAEIRILTDKAAGKTA